MPTINPLVLRTIRGVVEVLNSPIRRFWGYNIIGSVVPLHGISPGSNPGSSRRFFDEYFVSPLFISMKTIELKCKYCGKSFTRAKKEYDRQTRKGRGNFYCSISCSTKDNLPTPKSKVVVRECLWCKTEFESSTKKRHRKCCSFICSRKYSRSKVDKKKHLDGCKKYRESENYFPPPCKPKTIKNRKFTCIICGEIFYKKMDNYDFTHKPRKTCYSKCKNKLLKKISRENPNCGGETNYRKYKYNDIWMDSSWEVKVAKCLDKKCIKWDRSRKHVFWWTDENGEKRRYYPDFYLPKYGVYLDPKNKYKMVVDEYKMNSVIQENDIKIIWGLVDDVIERIKDLK